MRKAKVSERVEPIESRFCIDISLLDDALRTRCREIAVDFHTMEATERMLFMDEVKGFPVDEKILLLDTCIRLLEETEEFEICATLLRMKLLLQGIA